MEWLGTGVGIVVEVDVGLTVVLLVVEEVVVVVVVEVVVVDGVVVVVDGVVVVVDGVVVVVDGVVVVVVVLVEVDGVVVVLVDVEVDGVVVEVEVDGDGGSEDKRVGGREVWSRLSLVEEKKGVGASVASAAVDSAALETTMTVDWSESTVLSSAGWSGGGGGGCGGGGGRRGSCSSDRGIRSIEVGLADWRWERGRRKPGLRKRW